MRRAAFLLASLALAAWAPAGAHAAGEHGAGHGAPGHGGADRPAPDAGTHAVAIADRAYSPARLTVLEGDAVTWRNQDLMIHNVSAAGGAIFSGGLNRGQTFTHSFSAVGSYPFLCTLHPFMRGQVDVHAAVLHAASSSVLNGQQVALHGRAAPGARVTIEQQPAGATTFSPLLSVPVDSAGRFEGMVRPRATTAYRAVADRGASPAVTVGVAAELRVTLTARRSGRRSRLRVAAPGAAGATATLQLYSRERFTWVDRRRSRLDAAGRTAFSLRAGLRYHARVLVASPDGAVLGTSRSVRLPR